MSTSLTIVVLMNRKMKYIIKSIFFHELIARLILRLCKAVFVSIGKLYHMHWSLVKITPFGCIYRSELRHLFSRPTEKNINLPLRELAYLEAVNLVQIYR